MVGLLVTMGVLVSLTPPANIRTQGIVVAIVASLLGAMYFIKGMDTYGGILNERVPNYYLVKFLTFPHKMMILIGVLAALGAAGWDLWLVISLSR